MVMEFLNPHRFDPPLDAAHTHCANHRAELASSSHAGCFYCGSIFSPNEVFEWIDDGQTALCPHCGIDAVIGSASNFPITTEFLGQMHDHWF